MTDTERITALEQQVAELKALLGNTTRAAAADLDARATWKELGNGDYPLFQRIHEVGDSQNGIVERMEGFPRKEGAVKDYINERIASIQLPSSTDPDPRIPALQTELGKVKASIAAIPPGGDVIGALAAKGVFLNNGAITLRASNGFACGVGISENDNGFRINYNLDPERGWVNPTTGARTSYSNPKMMQILIAVERDGVVSVNYFKPLVRTLEDGTLVEISDGPFDGPAHGGKALCIRPGGHNALGQRGPHAEIYNGLQNRGMRFGTAGATAPNAVDDWSIVIEPDGSVTTR